MSIAIKVTVDASRALSMLRAIKTDFNKSALLKAIGLRQVGWIDQNFRTRGAGVGGWKPLSPNTIAAKGGVGDILQGNPPKLRRSFESRVAGDSVFVGTGEPHAEYHELGGRGAYIIVPRKAKALAFMTAGGMVFRRKIVHPPLAQRKLLPPEEVAKDLAIQVIDGVVAKYAS